MEVECNSEIEAIASENLEPFAPHVAEITRSPDYGKETSLFTLGHNRSAAIDVKHLGYIGWTRGPKDPAPTLEGPASTALKPSIAVLPFDNMSGDLNQEYLSDGISDNIITRLARVPEMLVIARNSSFTYKDKRVKAQEVGRELGVRYVLERCAKGS